MSVWGIIGLCIAGAVFVGLIGWLLWSVEAANRKNPNAKTNTFGGGWSFFGGDGAPENEGGTAGGTDGGGGGGGGDGGGGGGG